MAEAFDHRHLWTPVNKTDLIYTTFTTILTYRSDTTGDPVTQAVKPNEWAKLCGDWTGDIGQLPGALGAVVKLLTGDIRRILELAATTVLHSMGLPPPWANVAAKLFVKSCFTQLGTADATARRLQIMSIVFSADTVQLGQQSWFPDFVKDYVKDIFEARLDDKLDARPGAVAPPHTELAQEAPVPNPTFKPFPHHQADADELSRRLFKETVDPSSPPSLTTIREPHFGLG